MKKVLYLGLKNPDTPDSKFIYDKNKTCLIHYPIIKIVPILRDQLIEAIKKSKKASHLIFTSQTAVSLFFDHLFDSGITQDEMNKKISISVGKSTTASLKKRGVKKIMNAKDETAEGIIVLLKTLSLKKSFIFWPRSKLSRPLLIDYFLEENIEFEAPIFYDTIFHLTKPIPKFNEIDEIVFTSPSTVDAFSYFFPDLQKGKILTPIGKITDHKMKKVFLKNS